MDFWQFVHDNLNADTRSLRLKYHGKTIPGINIDLAITQIECRQKFAGKLRPLLDICPYFIFPSDLAGEQATSWKLAQLHTTLVPEGASVVDMTAGLGIDVFAMAMAGHKVHAIELDEARYQALAHNIASLHLADRVTAEHGDCARILGDRYDVAFIDPARRAADGSRIFAISDCQPDVVSLLPLIREHADTLVIKASPMLDITRLAAQLPGCTRIIALGNTRECKELVAVVDLTHPDIGSFSISAVTVGPDAENAFDFTPIAEREAKCEFGSPYHASYLYEPYPATMKAGPYRLLSQEYSLKKISANTHLYVGNDIVTDFPGETLEIWKVLPYQSKYIKTLRLEFPQINVTARNFDISAEALRKKLKVKDGGELRLFAFNDQHGNPSMAVTRPLRNCCRQQI